MSPAAILKIKEKKKTTKNFELILKQYLIIRLLEKDQTNILE